MKSEKDNRNRKFRVSPWVVIIVVVAILIVGYDKLVVQKRIDAIGSWEMTDDAKGNDIRLTVEMMIRGQFNTLLKESDSTIDSIVFDPEMDNGMIYYHDSLDKNHFQEFVFGTDESDKVFVKINNE